MAQAFGGILVAAGFALAPLLLLSPLSDLLCLLTVVRRRAERNRSAPARQPARVGRPPSLHFIVPAHNESLLIAGTVRSLRSMRAAGCHYRVTVLADACTDETVPRARQAGAEVLEFDGDAPVGKARLLERAIAAGIHEGYDAVVVIDADSTVPGDFADCLARTPDLRTIAQQAYHAVANPRDTWLTRLATWFARARYEWQLQLHASAGLNAPLTGNGMCIGTDVISKHGLQCATIKEDLELYARYTLAGAVIRLRGDAIVYAQESRSLRQARVQRVRWEAGKWGIVRRYALRLMTSRLPFIQRVDALAEITHHGPTIHTLAALTLGAALLPLSGLAAALGWALLATLIPMLTFATLSFLQEKDKVRLVVALMALPLYVVWRMGILALGLRAREAGRWIRSPRHVRG